MSPVLKLDTDGQEDLDCFIARISTFPAREQEDRLLEYFVEAFAGLTADDLRTLRARFLDRVPGSAATDTMVGVLDGHLMLQAIGG